MASGSSLARLEREGKLRRQEADPDYLEDLLAAAIHKTAREFWSQVRAYLKRENPQLALFEEIS